MDTQFNTLSRSYHDNYIQYKVTGSQTYQTAYQAAEQGLQTIVKTLQDQVDQQTAQISDFYKTDVEGKLRDTRSDLKKYQRKILRTEDEIEAAKLRSDAPPPSPPPQTPLLTQYITLSILGVVAVGLMALQ